MIAPNRDEALKLVNEYTKSESLLKHMLAVEAAMRAYARKFGPEALDFLPTPLSPLPEAGQQRLEAAIANMQKRMYLDYVHTRQESLLRGLPLPEEPMVPIGSKERNQLRRMLRDTRAVILFEKQVHPPLAFIRTTAMPDLP